MSQLIKELAQKTSAWPFELARKILKRINNKTPDKGYVLFEAGYGPSGLPHIGTYGEMIRTKMVQNAFTQISDIPTKFFVISDDMDGLRSIPENIPNHQMLEKHLQEPLTSIPDPFNECQSYGHYMNKKLREFLDHFGFEYEFKSATELYKTGQLDEYLLKALKNYDKIMKIMLPTLREERQKTYSPFLPICPETNKVLYVQVIDRDIEKGTITYLDEKTKQKITMPVTEGKCKLQWKPDFGVRWAALDVDFEMYGKDHLANGKIYSSICRAVGGNPPEQFFYELFLDEEGRKISKSKGNGITIDEWLQYAPLESLAFYMYQHPRKAKKLYFDVIPKAVDEYIAFLNKFNKSNQQEQLDNPVAHVHNFEVPKHELHGLTFNLLINLASACNPTDQNILLGFISKYATDFDPAKDKFIYMLSSYARKYYENFIKPNKVYKTPDTHEKELLERVKKSLQELPKNATASDAQNIFYTVAKIANYENMRDFFLMIYETLLGQKEGPRLGSFVLLYGIDKTIELINSALKK
ncbi:MAG: lysine--tRNA ligase [Rickettsiales bacterium]|nr:lysine--tRNA ligase [Rickettsiales bacterium]